MLFIYTDIVLYIKVTRQLVGAGAYCGGLWHSLLISASKVYWKLQPTTAGRSRRFSEMHGALRTQHIICAIYVPACTRVVANDSV